jgi:hypothetical protein
MRAAARSMYGRVDTKVGNRFRRRVSKLSRASDRRIKQSLVRERAA